MSRDSLRYLILIGLLVVAAGVAIFAVWLPRARSDGAPAGEFSFATDIDNWRQTDQWRTVHSPYDFSLDGQLSDLPLTLGNWTGEDVPQSNLEVFILLEPEQYVQRRYADSAGHSLWLSLIGSHKSKSFHPPQICYSADGWRTELSSATLALRKGEVYALRLDAEKENQRQLVLYFYLWPDASRDPAQGTVLFKMTLVLDDQTDAEAARKLAESFLQAAFSEGVAAE